VVLSTLPGARTGLRSASAPGVVRKTNLAGEPSAPGRTETRQFVSLAQEFFRHGFWKPRGVGPCFAE
jgi:hypothetical protein